MSIRRISKLLIALSLLIIAIVITTSCSVQVKEEPIEPIKIKIADFYVDIWVNRGEGSTYYVGESIKINFRASKDAYVTIYDYDTAGYVRQIFPNWYHKSNFVQAHRVYSIPGAGYTLEIDGPAGREELRIVAVLSRSSAFIDYGFSASKVYPRVSSSHSGFSSSLRVRLSSVPNEEWAEDTTHFYISY